MTPWSRCPSQASIWEGPGLPQSALRARAGAQPVADLGPESSFGAAARHEADVARVEDENSLSSLPTSFIVASAWGRVQMWSFLPAMLSSGT